MEKFLCFEGLVIRATPSGEGDKMLTILSRQYGKLSVLARGCRKVNSRLASCCNVFVYASFSLGIYKDMYYIREAEFIRSFYKENDRLEKFALASYIVQVGEDISTNEESHGLMRLLLNTLHVLDAGEKNEELIKAGFELRVCKLCGLSPELSGCRICGKSALSECFLEVNNGTLICEECKNGKTSYTDDARFAETIVPLDSGSLGAMRHISNADDKRIFSFNIYPPSDRLFYDGCEKYMTNQLERSFSSLEFYKLIKQE